MAIRTLPSVLLLAVAAAAAVLAVAPVPSGGSPLPADANPAAAAAAAAFAATATATAGGAAANGAPAAADGAVAALPRLVRRGGHGGGRRSGNRSANSSSRSRSRSSSRDGGRYRHVTPTPTPTRACIDDDNACTCRLSAPSAASECVDAFRGAYCHVRTCEPSYVCDCSGNVLCTRKTMKWRELACATPANYGYCKCDVVMTTKEMVLPMGTV